MVVVWCEELYEKVSAEHRPPELLTPIESSTFIYFHVASAMSDDPKAP
jgi:hypothetical protein